MTTLLNFLKTSLVYFLATVNFIDLSKCPDDWKHFHKTNQCYRFYNNTPLDWNQSRVEICQDLISIESHEENQFVLDLIGGMESWIGLSDLIKKDDWVWSDGSETDYTYWAAGQPYSQYDQDCAVMNFGTEKGKWVAYPCEEPIYFVCKAPIAGLTDFNLNIFC